MTATADPWDNPRLPLSRDDSSYAVASTLEGLRNLPPERERAIMGKRRFKRHANANKRVGGFVELTAKASEDSFVDRTSLVLNEAEVSGRAQIVNSVVAGHAKADDTAQVINSELSGTARVHGTAVVVDARLRDGLITDRDHGLRPVTRRSN